MTTSENNPARGTRHALVSGALWLTIAVELAALGYMIYLRSPFRFPSIQPTASIAEPDASALIGVAFAPDGKTIAYCGTYEHRIKGMLKTRRLHEESARELITSSKEVTKVAFLADGNTLVAIGLEGAVDLFTVDTGRRQQLDLKDFQVAELAISSDGHTLALTDYSQIKLWNRSLDKQATTFGRKVGTTMALTFSPDGQTLATGSFDAMVRVWFVPEAKLLATLRGHRAKVTNVAFGADGRTLYSSGEDGTIRRWDLTGHQVPATLPVHGYIDAMALSPDGKTLATSTGAKLMLWDAATGLKKATLPGLNMP
jgi:WD40 repeat protein